MLLEKELIEIFAAKSSQRNRDILIGYYGWKDGQEHTLTEIGTRYGITRERVRQICAKMTKRAMIASPAAPVMDRVLALIAERLPCPAAAVEAELVEKKLTAIGMNLDHIATAARLLGRPVRFRTINVHSGAKEQATDTRLIIQSDQAAAVLSAVDMVKKEIYFHGLATVDRIQQAIAARYGERADMGLMRQVLLLIDGFCWLDEASGWFRLQPVERHGLPKAIDKVLSVAGSVTVGELHRALSRNRRLWKEPPPEKVLLEFCRQMPRVRIEGDRVISDPSRDWKKSLTGVEAKLVNILTTHGPVMERGAMEDLCVSEGMNRFSFHAFVSWSPVIAQYGHSVYGLLGTKVTDKQVKELMSEHRAQRANHRVLDQHGLTDDGRVWLSYRLSKAASTYAVITIPAALKKVIRGRFQFVDAAGRELGTLATKDGRAWGLGAFLRKQGATIGDHITLTLDLDKRTAVVTWDDHGKKKREKEGLKNDE
jgi:hypothetical protein